MKEGDLTRLRKMGLPKDDLLYLIDQWILKERDRELLKHCLVDGVSIEMASELVDCSPRGAAKMIKRGCSAILLHVH